MSSSPWCPFWCCFGALVSWPSSPISQEKNTFTCLLHSFSGQPYESHICEGKGKWRKKLGEKMLLSLFGDQTINVTHLEWNLILQLTNCAWRLLLKIIVLNSLIWCKVNFFLGELPQSCVIVKSSSRKAAGMSVEVVGKNRTAVFCGNLYFGYAMRRWNYPLCVLSEGMKKFSLSKRFSFELDQHTVWLNICRTAHLKIGRESKHTVRVWREENLFFHSSGLLDWLMLNVELLLKKGSPSDQRNFQLFVANSWSEWSNFKK